MKHCFSKITLCCALVGTALFFNACDITVQASNLDLPQEEILDNNQDKHSRSNPENPTTPDEPKLPTEIEIPHQHQYGDWVITIEPNCIQTGKQQRQCSCGDTEEENIPSTGHDYQLTDTQTATCTQTGLETYTCQNCQDYYTKTVDRLEHQYVEERVEPTCTEDGYTREYCSICNTTKSKTNIPHLEHEFEPDGNHTNHCIHCNQLQYDNPINDLAGSYWLYDSKTNTVLYFNTFEIIEDITTGGDFSLYECKDNQIISLSLKGSYKCFNYGSSCEIIFTPSKASIYYKEFTLAYNIDTDKQGNPVYQLNGKISGQNKTLTFIGYDL